MDAHPGMDQVESLDLPRTKVEPTFLQKDSKERKKQTKVSSQVSEMV